MLALFPLQVLGLPVKTSDEHPSGKDSFMNYAKHLETERLKLRPLLPTDITFIMNLIGDERVRLYLGGAVPEERREEAAEGYFRAKAGEVVWLVEVKVSRQPLGLVFISHHKDGNDSELSFMFDSNLWGLGYATEAAQRVLDHATREIGITKLIAETQSANSASRALLERLGMSEDRRLHRFGAEQIIYSIQLFHPG
jgi:ribosomal-protein-alanine N-acetyltransferase